MTGQAKGEQSRIEQSDSRIVTYYDILEERRRREEWSNEEQAKARYEVLASAAFAVDVRIGGTSS